MDLWDAGQQRIAREGRERLAELYVGVRDGVIAADVAVGRAKAKGDITPSYAQPSTEQRQATAARGLGQLMRDFPGNVATGKEFVQ